MGKIRGIQLSCVRKMIGFTRSDTESLDEFMERSNGTIKRLLNQHSIDRWDFLAHRAIYTWAGWMARLALYDPARLTLAILNHQNWAYIKRIADANGGRQLHGRILRTWRWERPLHKYREDWQSIALDADRWNALLVEMSNWRSVHR